MENDKRGEEKEKMRDEGMIDYTNILHREKIYDWCARWLSGFDKLGMQDKKALFIAGENSVGKTMFVERMLHRLNYDVIKFDSGDTRGSQMIEQISHNNIAKESIMSWVSQKKKRVAIMIDEVDVINSVDKTNTILSLIKLIRPKKTKRQKNEMYSLNPVICIGNITNDRMIDDLLNVCYVIELKKPTKEEMKEIFMLESPRMYEKLVQKKKKKKENIEEEEEEKKLDWMLNYVNGNLSRFHNLLELYEKDEDLENFMYDIEHIYRGESFIDDSKMKTQYLFENRISILEHQQLVCENERNILNLLWHENVIDNFPPVGNGGPSMKEVKKMEKYVEMLENICFSDFFDRLVFQKQIYQFNEMTSFIKTCKNNQLFHDFTSLIESESQKKKTTKEEEEEEDSCEVDWKEEEVEEGEKEGKEETKEEKETKEEERIQEEQEEETKEVKEKQREGNSFFSTSFVNVLEVQKKEKKERMKEEKGRMKQKCLEEKKRLKEKERVLGNVSVIKGKNIRFTKILTKYATEFNNFLFLQTMCGSLYMDKKDIIGTILFQLKDSCCEWKSLSLFSRIKEDEMKHKSEYVDIHPLVEFFQQYDISFSLLSRLIKYVSHLQMITRAKEATSFEKQSSKWIWVETKSSEKLELFPKKYPCLGFTSFLSFPSLKQWSKEDNLSDLHGQEDSLQLLPVSSSLSSSPPNISFSSPSFVKLEISNLETTLEKLTTTTQTTTTTTTTQTTTTKEKTTSKPKTMSTKKEKVGKEKEKKKKEAEEKTKEEEEGKDRKRKMKMTKEEKEKKKGKKLREWTKEEEEKENRVKEIEQRKEKEKAEEEKKEEEKTLTKEEEEKENRVEIGKELQNMVLTSSSTSLTLSSSSSNSFSSSTSFVKKRNTIKKNSGNGNVMSKKDKEAEKDKEQLLLIKQQANFRNFLNTNKNVSSTLSVN